MAGQAADELLGWLVHNVTPVAAGWLPLLVILMLGLGRPNRLPPQRSSG